MREQLRKLKKDKLTVIVIVLALLGLFYWFQIRPSMIKSDCSAKASEYLKKAGEEHTTDFWREAYNLRYETCLNRNGL